MHVILFYYKDNTFWAYKWQNRRKLEKIEEIELRKKRLKNEPLKIGKEYPWIDKSEDEFREKWEFLPINLNGYFDLNKTIQ